MTSPRSASPARCPPAAASLLVRLDCTYYPQRRAGSQTRGSRGADPIRHDGPQCDALSVASLDHGLHKEESTCQALPLSYGVQPLVDAGSGGGTDSGAVRGIPLCQSPHGASQSGPLKTRTGSDLLSAPAFPLTATIASVSNPAVTPV